MPRRIQDVWLLTGGLVATAVTVAAFRLLEVSNSATIALTLMLVVLVVAAAGRLWIAVVVSVVATGCLNFFFLPPVGTLTIAEPQNWVALFAFLAVSLVASNLSSAARSREAEAHTRRDELARLFDLSRDILMMPDTQAMPALARSVATRFALGYVGIALPGPDAWQMTEAGVLQVAPDQAALSTAFARATGALEFDARERTYGGHATEVVRGEPVRIVPLRVGTKAIGLLAAAGRPIEAGTLDVLAGIVALAIERARFMDERRAAEATRHSEALKSALLASLAHDLRTPLTAIRVAAANLQDPQLGEPDRADQADVILSEVERLRRLFENILAMARIDAGPIATTVERVLPTEILAAARDQVAQGLRRHRLDVRAEPDDPITLDPRLTASALAHVLENAAQYSPAGSTIRVEARIEGGEWRVTVADAGPGIAATDLPRVFDRFYRGEAAASRPSGTGMGLAIARGLLSAEGGRIWAENLPQGGAAFTLAVPVERSREIRETEA